ncbi:MAG: peptidylprolyl isomerase FKBP-type [Lachnospiraceae bacterium]|jgi:trigger factor|nr:peptidylprolyl isomerase FKBP-type [Lachnospiraceae bacterium]
MGNQNEKTMMSKGQMKRVARKKEVKKLKKQAQLTRIITFSVVTLLAVGIVSLIGYSVYTNITSIKPSSDYSKLLTEDGSIKDITATDYLKLADYKNITAPLSEIEYSDESVDTDIETILGDYKTLDTKTPALIADGDTVNIDYVGTVDGVEFDGGNTDGAGADLEIGSGSYIDDFEDQLIGHGVGDEVTVEATFPTDYQDENLAGKDAVFEVVINGIYVLPEFTDAFVQENLSENASTVEEYREYLKQSNYEDNLTTWLEEYLMENTTVTSYPEEYTNHLKSIKKYEDQSTYESMNEFYASMGYGSYSSFEEYVGMSESKYDAGLTEFVQEQAKKNLIYQAITETEGLTATADEFSTYLADSKEDYDAQVEKYGKGYVIQEILQAKVLKQLKESVTVK